MAIIIPNGAQGKALVNWDSNDGVTGDDMLSCMTDGDLTTLCSQIGLGSNDCAKFLIPGLINAVEGDTVKIWWTARMLFPSISLLPYDTATGVGTANAILQGANPGNSPATLILTSSWIAELHDRGSAEGAFRIVEFNSSPIAGNISITEVQVNLGPDAEGTPLMWGRAF